MHVDLRLPLPNEQIFRYGAMDDILEIVASNPTSEFTNKTLQEKTGYGGPSVSRALSILVTLDLLYRRDDGRRTLYRINESKLHGGDDPYLDIPQQEFRRPLKRYVECVTEASSNVVAILCFGSVAHGEADRTSDLDVLVLIGDHDELTIVRRQAHDCKQDIEESTFDGQRYEFEVFAESIESATRRGEEFRPLLQEGVPLYKTERFQTFIREFFGGEAAR